MKKLLILSLFSITNMLAYTIQVNNKTQSKITVQIDMAGAPSFKKDLNSGETWNISQSDVRLSCLHSIHVSNTNKSASKKPSGVGCNSWVINITETDTGFNIDAQ